jgi:hypothetical protein
MLRALGAFLVVFSLLSLIVNLNGIGTAFAIGALFSFAIDFRLAQSNQSLGRSRIPGHPLR